MSVHELFNQREWVRETHLPIHLGVNRDDLRHLRKKLLAEGTDFRRFENRIELSLSGVEKLEAHLKLPPPAVEDVQPSGPASTPPLPLAPKKSAPPAAQDDAMVVLLVWRANLPNRRIVEAYKKGANPAQRKNVLRVRVRDATRFSRFDNTGQPMTMTCRHIQADLYEFVGPVPKHRGRY